jgi:hypothetical protein
MVWNVALRATDVAVTVPWSIGEAVTSLLRPGELPPDRSTAAVARDIGERGFYVDVPERPELRPSGNVILGENPYRFVAGHKRRGKHRIVGKLVRAKKVTRADKLLVVFHCYGIPSPWAMSKLFGLDDMPDTDVAYGIMSHHQRDTYPWWPGSGLASASPACMVENLRSAVTGARTFLRGLRELNGYKQISVVGYSIGGFLAQHIANTEDVHRVTLYCPVVSMERMRAQLGLMPVFYGVGKRLAVKIDPTYSDDLLMHSDPLRHPLRVPQESVRVIVQRNDKMTTPEHISAIRQKYPNVGWEEFGGTHLIPLGRSRIRELLRE